MTEVATLQRSFHAVVAASSPNANRLISRRARKQFTAVSAVRNLRYLLFVSAPLMHALSAQIRTNSANSQIAVLRPRQTGRHFQRSNSGDFDGTVNTHAVLNRSANVIGRVITIGVVTTTRVVIFTCMLRCRSLVSEQLRQLPKHPLEQNNTENDINALRHSMLKYRVSYTSILFFLYVQ